MTAAAAVMESPSVVPPLLRPVASAVPVSVPEPELSAEELASRIVGLSGRLAVTTCRWLLLVARFDALDGAWGFGLPSTARWLAAACGLAHRTAVEHVRVARALARFPALSEAMGAGVLSFSQVRAISRVPHEDEGSAADVVVADLIEVARHGSAAQLESVVRGLRTVDDVETGADAVAPPEYVRSGWTARSQWQGSARLAPEDGAVVESALDLLARTEKLTRPQALVRMAEIALAALTEASAPPRRLRGDERAAVVIHLDPAALPPSDAEPAVPRSAERDDRPRAPLWPFGRIADGPGLPARVIERLLCQGRIRTVLRGCDGSVLDLGRSQRVVSDRQYRALMIRDHGTCRYPGCPTRSGLEAHHIRHWLRGGRTDMDNLLLLCAAHHHAHHDGKFGISRAGGAVVFRRADGRDLAAGRPRPGTQPADEADDADEVDGMHLVQPADSEVRLMPAERLDHHYTIGVLAHARSTARTGRFAPG